MRFKQTLIYTLTVMLLLMLILTGSGWAAFSSGQSAEIPKPVLTKDGEDWVAELIPKGKITQIEIRFHVDGGTLAQPVIKEFTESDSPDINLRNYWSGFFTLDITPFRSNGETSEKVELSVSSDFFLSSTDIWGKTGPDSGTWGNINSSKRAVTEKINAITSVIRDGSVMDEDGMADGKIRITIGPRDKFWNFAIGTLVIRTFGIFLMLIALMVGMMLSGSLFKFFDGKALQNRASTDKTPAPRPGQQETAEPVSEPIAIEELPDDMAAAIAMAIHLATDSGKNLDLSQNDDMTAAAIGLALHLGSE